MKKTFAFFLALAMVLSLLPAGVMAADKNTPQSISSELEAKMKDALFSADEQIYSEDYTEPNESNPDDIVRAIVEIKTSPALEVAAAGSETQARNAEVMARKSQEATISAAQQRLGLEPVNRSAYLVNTVSYDIRRGDMEKLKKLPGVVSVTEAARYRVDMFSAKEMAQVYDAWKMGETGYTGKGVVISVIDTGVNYLHHDMHQNSDTVKYTKSDMEKKIKDLGYGQWFSDKVAFGYSYVSARNDVLNNANIHGYHVAGIAAANGDENQRYISGVAPDAQVFAMQVFEPETGAGGYSDDIICAIEDSVKLGADIINMSLGIDCGFYEEDRYMNSAVNKANEQGVFVAISAGNAGISTSIYKDGKNDWGLTDTATVSDPSAAYGGVSIASVEGNGYLAYSFDVTIAGEARSLSCMRLTNADIDVTDVSFYDAGNGDYTVFGDYVVDDDWNYTFVPNPDVVGKIVLVSYSDGDYAPFTAISYAEMAGCAGVIAYYTGGDMMPLELRYKASEEYSIPAVCVGSSDGAYLLELAAAETSAQKVKGFDGYFYRSSNKNVTASVFSAWGPTPSLEIKPEIAGPGGMIFSLAAGENYYTVMSGTSMSAPFVAGVAALVRQYMNEFGIETENDAEFIRHTLMNTANPVVDEMHKTLYSVRQQGAGLVNASAALENTVTVTYNGKAAIELKDELSRNTSGTLLLNNYGTSPVTYSLSSTDVYTDYTDPDTRNYYDVVLEGAKVTFSPAVVVVPAGGTAEVAFKLTIPKSRDGHFAEGYILLQSTNAPQLSIPFLGFMGDWDDEPIIDLPEWDEDKVIKSYEWYAGYVAFGTGLVSTNAGNAAMLGEEYTETPVNRAYIQPENIAISPNGDGRYDIAIPWLGLLRNAHDVKFSVTDKTGKVLFESGTVTMLRKLLASDTTTHGVALMTDGYAIGWDGTTYDPSTGTRITAPEGDYVVRIQARVREGGDWQSIELPLAIDLTAPTFESISAQRNEDGTLTVSFSAKDQHGLHNVVAVNVNGRDNTWTRTRTRWDYDAQTDTYTMTFDPSKVTKNWNDDINGTLSVYIMIADKSGNTTMKGVTIPAINQEGHAECGLYNMSLDKPTYVGIGSNKTAWFYGYAPEGSTATFNGKEATFHGKSFSVELALTEQVTPVEVIIRNADGENLLSGKAQLVLDRDDPFHTAFQTEGEYTAKAIGSGWALMLDRDYPVGTKVKVRTKIIDTSDLTIQFKNNGTGESQTLQPDDQGYLHFEVELAELPELGDGLIGAQCNFMFTDAVGYYRYTNLYVYTRSTAQYGASIGSLDAAENLTPVIQNVSTLTQITQDMLQMDGTFRVEGYLFNQVDKLLVNGVEAFIDPESLLWYCDIPLRTGMNNVNALAIKGEAQGESYLAQIYYTGAGPAVTLNVYPDCDGIYRVYGDHFQLRGSVTTLLDDAQIYVNDYLVDGAYDFGNASGSDTIIRDFSYELKLNRGHNYVTVFAADYSGAAASLTFDLYYTDFPFKDVAEDAWYRDYVAFGYASGLIKGMTDTAFAPDVNLTRAQMVTMLYRMADEPDITMQSAFSDVRQGQWYTDAVTWAHSEGIVKGVTETTFCPNADVTREQAAAFLYRYVTRYLKQKPVDGIDLSVYKDEDNISAYAREAVAWATAEGIFHGFEDGTMQPKGSLTRAQMAKLLTVLRQEF